MEYPHKDIKRLIYSFEKYNAIYFRVPKVASSSLLITLRQVDNLIETEKYDKSRFKFAFVRNPFDRLASCYRHVIQKGALKNIQNDSRFYRNMSFNSFVDAVSKIEIKNMDIHFRPQYTFIPEKPNYLGKFESLNEDYMRLCKIIGIRSPPALLHENKTDKTKFKDYYNETIVKKVSIIYKKDFELFNYLMTINL